MKRKPKCPHCGNTDPLTIQHNGASGADRSYLCVRPCIGRPEESSFADHPDAGSPELAEALKSCGMQWDPADYDQSEVWAELSPWEAKQEAYFENRAREDAAAIAAILDANHDAEEP